jgi:MATE family multidrug resistance protein
MTQPQTTAFSAIDILKRSIPLMFAALSTNIMTFFDRLMLARYSLDAMNATAAADMIFFTFMMIAVAITGIAEIFVGRYHGAQEYEKMGKPVWQMLWLSLLMSLICAPLGWVLKDWLLIPAFQKEGGNYLWILMSFVGLSAANAAISAFFVGKGETKWITIAVFTANVCNIILNSVLIFGWKAIPCLGTTGAALATIFSQTIQFICLASIFLNKKHRTFYKTADYQLDIKLLQACIKLGFPTALSHGFEMASWAYLTSFFAMHDTAYVTIQVIGNTMFNLFGFLTEGLQKGVTSLAANIMGSNNRQLIYNTKRSAFRVQYAFTALLSIPLLIYPDYLISLFLQDIPLDIVAKIRLTLIGVWGYFLLDGLNWILVGLITSAGYTGYAMLANTSAWWIGALCPGLIAVHYFNIPAHMIWTIFLPLYTLMHFCLLHYKFKIIHWEKGLMLGRV